MRQIQKKKYFKNIKGSILFGLFIFSIYNLTAQDVRINEIVSSNSVYTDEDGDTPDWLEIHNFGTEDVSMNGWTLSDDINNLSKWTFPNYTLSPNEYLLLWASDKDRSSMSYHRTLVNQGDEFKYLIPTSEPDGNWNDLNFDDSNWSSGSSGFGYADGDDATTIPNGTQSIYLRKTFAISSLATISSLILDMDYDDAFVAYINGNEVARANINGTPPAYNSGTITDREAQMYTGGKPERFLITDFNSILKEGQNILTIQAHNISAGSSDFTLIPFLSANFTTPNSSGSVPPAILGLTNMLHTNFKISSNLEIVRLTNALGETLSQLTAENLPENTSIGISTTSGAIVSYIETTPGLENATQEYLGSVQSQVIFSNQGGLINAPISLRLSGNTSEEVIRYTINKDTPTETSTLYTNPIQINEDTTVRAQIFLDNYIPSAVTTKTYILNTSNLTFTDSNLPIVIINTQNAAEILNEPKILGTMKIIQRPDGARNYVSDADTEDFLDYAGTISIETRGSSSQVLPKKPYGFSTLTADGAENDNVKLLGMPKENDWILNSFAFDDSMMRDYISYTMARQMGQYAVNLKYCEVIINGDYKGLYALSEKIKVDGDRVNIAKLAADENTFPEVTGGYLVQTDRPSDEDPEAWYNNGAGYINEKPNAEDITPTQAAYIETVFRTLDQTAGNADIRNGYPAVIDVPSFVDYMLMAEITSNPDAYALSTFYHKDRGGKLRAGPVWDYNLTYGNDLGLMFGYFFDRSFTDVWQYKFSNVGANFWGDLFEGATFKCYASKRFNEVTATGGPLNYEYIAGLIDTTVASIAEAVVRDTERWDTIEDFSSEISTMKTWLQQRIVWMKNNLGQFSSCSAVETPSLVIKKIHYNPQETTEFPESDDQEFIEIKNTGSTLVALTGIYLVKLGVSYQFPQNATLAGGKSVYLAGNATVFEQKYGFAPFDTFLRDLSNKSHHLVLADAFGNLIDQVAYADGAPWPEEADGDGFYLELIDVLADNSIASNWKASADGVLSTTDFNTLPVDFSVYPNPTAAELHINAARILQKIEIYNLLGQQIKTVQVNLKSATLNISDLKKGMYLLNLKFIDGTRATTKIFKK
jgi:hypothetical protein